MSCFCLLLTIVSLNRLVVLSLSAVWAKHGELPWQALCAIKRDFAGANRTADASVVGFGDFSGLCHDCLLSYLGGLTGSSFHNFNQASQLFVDLPEPIRGKLRRIGDSFVCARHLSEPNVRRKGVGE
jgi:hypothetical protein